MHIYIPDEHWSVVFQQIISQTARYPTTLTLESGNMDPRQITQICDFYVDYPSKYKHVHAGRYDAYVFDYLMLSIISDGVVLCIHGGFFATGLLSWMPLYASWQFIIDNIQDQGGTLVAFLYDCVIDTMAIYGVDSFTSKPQWIHFFMAFLHTQRSFLAGVTRANEGRFCCYRGVIFFLLYYYHGGSIPFPWISTALFRASISICVMSIICPYGYFYAATMIFDPLLLVVFII